MHCSITIKGHLDTSWSAWFDGLTIANRENGETALVGHLPDQAALHGALTKVRDLGLTLIAVQCGDIASTAAPPARRYRRRSDNQKGTRMKPSVRHVQEALIAALLHGDAQTLDTVIAPDCRIIGPRGFVTTRDEWIGAHQESTYTQVKLENAETDVRIYGDAAIRWEVQESVCRYHGETIEGRFNVTGVWVLSDGRWQLTSLQYTALPS
jgi:uncharacterized protein (TIGR02246 family)